MRQAKRAWAFPLPHWLDIKAIIIAAMALGLLIGMIVRIGPMPSIWSLKNDQTGGLRALSAQDQLVLFEDFEFHSGAWAGAAQTALIDPYSGMLGPVPAGLVMQRPLRLPRGYRNAVLELDVLFFNDWQGAAVEVNFADVLLRISGTVQAPVLELARQNRDGVQFQILDHRIPATETDAPMRLCLRLAVRDYDLETEVTVFGTPDETSPYEIGLDNLRVIVSDTPLEAV